MQRRPVLLLVAAVAYVLATRLTLATQLPSGAVALWPPAGVGLAIVWLGGARMWPGLLAGAYVAKQLGSAGPLAAIPGAIGPTVEALVCAWALRRLREQECRRVEQLAASTVAAALLSAVLGVGGLWLQGVAVGPDFPTAVARWAMGDLGGMLLVAPIAVAPVLRRPGMNRGAALEGAVLATGTIATTALLFQSTAAQLWLLAVPLVWIVVRRGLRTAFVTGLGSSVVAIHATVAGRGPLATGGPHDVLRAQLFAIVFTGALLTVTALTEERRRLVVAHRRISDEDAALRRVATAVAGGTALHAVQAGGEDTAGGRCASTPVLVAGRRWGTLVARPGWPGGLGPDTPARLARFANLLGLAIDSVQAHEQLLAQATTDPLTGALNHRAFHERLREEVALATRQQRPLSLAVFDLDRFKQVNDTLGHLAGDTALAEAGRRLRAAAREGEAVARLGGDEFALLMPGTTANEAQIAAERLRLAVAGTPLPGAGAMSVSGGVCSLAEAGSADDLLRLADGALYWAKAHGRDACVRYSPEVVEELSAAERAERLEHARALAALGALARAIDAKDPATIAHSQRVAEVAALLAQESGWSPADVRRMHDAALVHDVGKIGVPDAVLSKPSRLDADEYELIKRHADLGARIVAGVLDAEQVGWVRGHHERHDGRGYPDGLAASAIGEGARLLALADAWDAMTAGRAYSASLTEAQALAEVRRETGRQFHPDAVQALLRLHARQALAPGAQALDRAA